MLGWNINLCYATILRWFPHELVIYPLLLKEKKYVNYLFFYLNKAVIRNGVVKFCGKYKSSFVALLYNDNILQSFFLFQDDFAKYTASKYSIYIRIWVYYYEKWLCYITTFFWQTLFEDLDYPTLWSTAINKVS